MGDTLKHFHIRVLLGLGVVSVGLLGCERRTGIAGEVFLVSDDGTVVPAAGARISALPYSDSTNPILGLDEICRDWQRDEAALQARRDSVDREFRSSGDLTPEWRREWTDSVTAGAAASSERFEQMEFAVAELFAGLEEGVTGTGRDGTYSLDLSPGTFIMMGKWEFEGERKFWLEPVTLEAGESRKIDLTPHNLAAERSLCFGPIRQ